MSGSTAAEVSSSPSVKIKNAWRHTSRLHSILLHKVVLQDLLSCALLSEPDIRTSPHTHCAWLRIVRFCLTPKGS